MAKYIIVMKDAYTDELIEEYYEEIYDSYADAEKGLREWNEGFSAGADVLDEMGEDFTDPDDVYFEIEEYEE